MPKELSIEEYSRLQEIQKEMISLLGEAWSLVKQTKEADRAKGYWYGNIMCQLTTEHDFMCKEFSTMEHTINALEPYENDEA